MFAFPILQNLHHLYKPIVIAACMAAVMLAPASKAETLTVVTGKTVDRPDTHTLVVAKYNDDFRTAPTMRVDVNSDGAFQFSVSDSLPTRYSIYCLEELQRGSWHTYSFFAEGNSVRVTIQAEGYDIESNGREQQLATRHKTLLHDSIDSKFDGIYKKFDELRERNALYAPEFDALIDSARKVTDATLRDALYREISKLNDDPKRKYSPEGYAVERMASSLMSKRDSLSQQFIADNVSRFGLSEIISSLSYLRDDVAKLRTYDELLNGAYKSAFSDDDPQMAEALMLLGSRGLKVVGVARESGDLTAYNMALEKDAYPWENFVDMNDVNNIWKMNGVPNAGGRIRGGCRRNHFGRRPHHRGD